MVQNINPFLIFCSLIFLLSLPINNGLTVKYHPKEKVGEKVLVPGELASEENNDKDDTLKSHQSNASDSFTLHQLGKVVYSWKNESSINYEAQNTDDITFINLPILRQPFDDYKVLVVTAPSNLKVTKDTDENHLVIYVVLPDNLKEESSPMNIPIVYFVGDDNGIPSITEKKKEKAESVLVVDSNRTITGLKSKEIEKYVRFKNKITSRYKYEVLP